MSLWICAAGVLVSVTALAADPATAPKVDAAAAAARAAKTAAALAVLKQEEGVWDAAIEFPPSEPGKEATHATGVQTNTFVTGNTWIKNDFAVDAEYGGHGTWGYDPRKDKYVGIWVDSNQDYIRMDEGSYDAATQTITWNSELRQPEPYLPAKYRMTEQFKGNTRTLVMTAISPKSGKEVPLGTIVFTKRKAG